jgi:hypothetical protein
MARLLRHQQRHYAAALRRRALVADLAACRDPEQLDRLGDDLRVAATAASRRAAEPTKTLPCFKCGTELHDHDDAVVRLYLHAIEHSGAGEVNADVERFTGRVERFWKLDQPVLVLCTPCGDSAHAIAHSQQVAPADLDELRAELAESPDSRESKGLPDTGRGN